MMKGEHPDFFDCHTHMLKPQGAGMWVNLPMEVLAGETALDWREGVLYSAGIHPMHTGEWEPLLHRLRQWLEEDRLAAVGECGLDKRSMHPMSEQMACLERQMQWANEWRKPLIVHCVRAWNELLEVHQKWPAEAVRIVHGFRGKPQLARQLLQAGWHLSFGWHYNVESLRLCPPERRHMETDEMEVSLQQVWDKQQRDLQA